jgi:hypothetical protein
LFINGVDMGVLETLAGENWSPGIILNAYLRIDATDGSVITSVSIESLSGQDFLGFSDFAVQPAAPPTVIPVLRGTLGLNGWYISRVGLSWTVTGNPAPTTSGCGSVTVPNTKGTTYTCSATNSLGSIQQPVTIRVDTVAPSATIKKPANNAVYALNASELASYTCADETSGVGSCVGTVVDGAGFATGTLGQQVFTVVATDNAGNTTTKTANYVVEPRAATPVFSPKEGTYRRAQTVSIEDATSGATIYYTTDGTTPTTSSPVYSAPISVSATETLKAMATVSGDVESAVKTAVYTIN